MFIVFEASFAKIERCQSAHAECAFFAVVAGSEASEEFEDTVDGD